MNVIPFMGVVTTYIVADAGIDAETGELVWMLDYVTPEGSAIVWTGETRPQAMRAAREWMADGLRVFFRSGAEVWP